MTKRKMSKVNQPTTGERCSCRPGIQRDNCSTCEGTGWRIDFRAIRAKPLTVSAEYLLPNPFLTK